MEKEKDHRVDPERIMEDLHPADARSAASMLCDCFHPEDKERIEDGVAGEVADLVRECGKDPMLRDAQTEEARIADLVDLTLLCRDHGVMPYWLTLLEASDLRRHFAEDVFAAFCEGEETNEVAHDIRARYNLDRRPDLSAMIRAHGKRMVDGVAEPEDLVALKKRAYAAGYNSEKTYRGCGQCTLLALYNLLGETDELLFQEATGLSGGMAICNDGACGGYTAGILLMGRFVGRRLQQMMKDGDKENQYKAYAMSQKLHDRFIEAFGSVVCKDIHEALFGRWFCLREKTVRDAFEEAGAHQDKCTVVIANASAWTAEILREYGYLSE